MIFFVMCCVHIFGYKNISISIEVRVIRMWKIEEMISKSKMMKSFSIRPANIEIGIFQY